jgi:pimeloyl-ACP methyl ester carboxylesterase
MRRRFRLALTLVVVWLSPSLTPVNAVQTPTPAACSSSDAPIAEAGFVPLGGLEQWVTITGRRCGNPILLFLHGGPGNPLSPYADALYSTWADDFTLVQWDQRGAGRTFGRNPPPDDVPLTVARMTADGIALAEYLTQRLGQPKVVVGGGSWGSILAVHMVKARPDLFHAYVGFSQVVSSTQNQAATYTGLLRLSREAGDTPIIESLEAMGPPPWTNPRHPGVVRRATRQYEGRATDPAPEHWWRRAPDADTPALRAQEEQGEEYSYLQFVGLKGDGMYSRVDLPALGTRFDVPVFMVQGAEDLVTMPEVTQTYFDAIEAPEKLLVTLPRTGHDPNERMMAAMRTLLTERVRPLLR